MECQTDVFLSLGSNLGDSVKILDETMAKIAAMPNVDGFKASHYYLTSPVSEIPQDDFVNAACRFHTSLPPSLLLEQLQALELEMGRVRQEKNAPRRIDIDILFYGTKSIKDPGLEVPHPRWMERLFVLTPLLDLVDELSIPDAAAPTGERTFILREYLRDFPNPHNEKVCRLELNT